MIHVGDDAPDFLVRSTTDRSIWLRCLRGRPVVLHFFPKGPVPDRAGDIALFPDSYAAVRSAGGEMIGIAIDDPSEVRLAAENVRFPVVCDDSTQITRAYGVLRRLQSDGKRITFGLSEAGIVEVVLEHAPGAPNAASDIVDWLKSRVPVDHDAAPRRQSKLAGEIIADRYQLKRRLAEGGIGVVWVAEHLELRQEVAIKLLKESTRADPDHAIHVLERFRHEAQLSALLGRRTSHVVHAQDAGFSEVGPFLVMELIDGRTLADDIDIEGPLAPERLLTVLEQVAEALTVAHEVGVVHRDLKPTNILLLNLPEGRLLAKVADFGLAKTINESLTLDRPQETGESTVVGTVDFMSPEQLRAGQQADPRMDVWALGVVAYEALTAKLPFEGPSVHAIMAKIVTAPFPRATSRRPTLPRALDAWFDKALAKDPKARFATAQELVAAYRTAIKSAPVSREKGLEPLAKASSPKTEAAAPTAKPKRRRAAILTGIAAGLLIGGTIASVLGLRYGRRSETASNHAAAGSPTAAVTSPLKADPDPPAGSSSASPATPGGAATDAPPAPSGATSAAPKASGKPGARGFDPSSVY